MKNKLTKLDVSVIVPVMNEAGNILPLIDEINNVYKKRSYEIIYVDDGSKDESLKELRFAQKKYKNLRVFVHEKCTGQSAAIRTGLLESKGMLIAILDGDGQNVPKDLNKIEKALISIRPSLGMAGGVRTKRQDSWVKKQSSKIAKILRVLLLNDRHPDSGCGIKIVDRDIFLKLPYFNNMHRFMPTLVAREGGKVINVNVSHRKRKSGNSKYGILDRLFAGIFDLIGVIWLIRRKEKSGKILELKTKNFER